MAEQTSNIPPIPSETRRRARAVFGNGNFYLRLGDELAAILKQCDWRELVLQEVNGPVPVHALVTIFQFLEDLSDTQARDALRSRSDWQYALHLPPPYCNLREDELCGYRQTIYGAAAMAQSFYTLTRLTVAMHSSDAQKLCPTSAQQLVEAVCLRNRLYWMLEAMRDLFTVLALNHADWLASVAQPHWYTTYWSDGSPLAGRARSAGDEEARMLGYRLGADLQYLWHAVQESGSRELRGTKEVTVLQRLLREQFVSDEQGARVLRQQCSFCGVAGTDQTEERT